MTMTPWPKDHHSLTTTLGRFLLLLSVVVLTEGSHWIRLNADAMLIRAHKSYTQTHSISQETLEVAQISAGLQGVNDALYGVGISCANGSLKAQGH